MANEHPGKRKEDEYFARIEFERLKKQVDARQHEMKNEERERTRQLHWMRCPKCGMEMVEVEFEGIKVDKCSSCLGVFFDNGELDQLSGKTKPGFLRRLQGLFAE